MQIGNAISRRFFVFHLIAVRDVLGNGTGCAVGMSGSNYPGRDIVGRGKIPGESLDQALEKAESVVQG